ncbi:tRNA (adenosine(37)-N6)-threonylcarbamoyltransferase complex ATPase subunit type 1 TsaE, partial [Acidimicrobiaceae bacterium USS-CC1]|nr:tRNA (adenosine(37)-N6)-threonylcarbamoyltransferase complex ATPase subunit type 1 TsaE [Acidiferrimicrobium australe]
MGAGRRRARPHLPPRCGAAGRRRGPGPDAGRLRAGQADPRRRRHRAVSTSPAPVVAVQVADLAGTAAVAAVVARLLRAGDLVLLTGDLGAGKTAFTQALAGELGVHEPVTSPTFTLVRQYPTDHGLVLLHADIYRLEQLAEVIDLGLPEQLEEGCAAVVEWGERGAPALVPEYLSVTLTAGAPDRETARLVELRPVGEPWR